MHIASFTHQRGGDFVAPSEGAVTARAAGTAMAMAARNRRIRPPDGGHGASLLLALDSSKDAARSGVMVRSAAQALEPSAAEELNPTESNVRSAGQVFDSRYEATIVIHERPGARAHQRATSEIAAR
jgi:hypothetical protein